MLSVRGWGVVVLTVCAATAAPGAPQDGGGDGEREAFRERARRVADSGRAVLVGEGEAEARLVELLDADFEAQMRFNPVWASRRGDRRYDDRLPGLGPEARAARRRHNAVTLAGLNGIDRAALSPEQALNAALLERELRRRLDEAAFKPWLTPVTQMWGPQRWLPDLVNQLSFTSEAQLEAYLSRLEQAPGLLDGTIADLREGVAAGLTPPRLVVRGAADQALAQGAAALAAGGARGHVMFQPFAGRDDGLAARAEALIADEVAPAFERLGRYLRDEYAPACRATIAAADRPDGEAYYAFQVRRHTTLELTPREVHEIGLSEVDRIRREMFDVIERSDFPERDVLSGDELFEAFTRRLREDPQFYASSAEELLDGYRAIGKRIDAEMPRLFGVLPRLSWGVREMPPFIARSSPTAYYYPGSIENGVPGYFVANTDRLDQRPLYEMTALTLHEAVPGHHHQNAIRQELEQRGLHRWRSLTGYTAFGEGWALYAERLGLEMEVGPATPRGLYEDPYADFGRLSYEMWRAMRLVVDTGIHAFGWSRGRAVSFMLSNSALTPENVEREVDRYIAWPGQALGYKIGELKIRELRSRAEGALGDGFDLRGFHDELLTAGSVPLDVLEARIDAWIDAQAAAPAG